MIPPLVGSVAWCVCVCQLTYQGAWFSRALRPWKPEGSLGRTAQDGHLDSHTAPDLCDSTFTLN